MIIVSGPVNNGKIMQYAGSSIVNFSYRYSQGDKLFAYDSKIENSFNRKYNYNYFGLYTAYALENDLSFEMETGYFSSQVEDFYIEKNTKSLSHLSLGSKYNFLGSEYVDELIGGLELKIPLNNQKIDTSGTLLPVNSSFGLGAAAIYNAYLNEDFNLIFRAKYDANFKNSEKSKFGNAFTLSSGLYYKMLRNLGLIASINADLREKSIYNEKEITNSGGQTVSFNIQASYSFDVLPCFISAGAGVPLYRYYQGVQSAENYNVFFNLLFSF